jgi:hypothetical protein
MESGMYKSVDTDGKLACVIETSSGDDEVDAMFCRTIEICSQASEHDTPEFLACMNEQDRELRLQLAMKRAGVPGRQ